MTISHRAVILNIERALPVDGQPSAKLQEVTALYGWRGGYFFLLTAIKRPIMPMITSVY